jgi:hypothetical protein
VFFDEVLNNAMPWRRMMSGHRDQGQIRGWPERRCARGRLGDMECSFLWRAIASERPLASVISSQQTARL